MKEFIEKLIGRLEEISVSRDNYGVINGCNMGICEDDDCLKCLKKKIISIVNRLAEEYKDNVMIDGQYCWQTCGATEHCKECNRLCNGSIDYYENYDFMAEEHNGGWIPCSERSPEEFGFYLVSRKDCIVSDMALYNKKFKQWDSDDIIAWQPLPEPYQPKGE